MNRKVRGEGFHSAGLPIQLALALGDTHAAAKQGGRHGEDNMLSRREGLGVALGLGIAGFPGLRAQAQAPSTVKTPVKIEVPPNSCDCHGHVFPDPAKFPFFNGRIYTPPVATADDLLALQKSLGMDRV